MTKLTCAKYAEAPEHCYDHSRLSIAKKKNSLFKWNWKDALYNIKEFILSQIASKVNVVCIILYPSVSNPCHINLTIYHVYGLDIYYSKFYIIVIFRVEQQLGSQGL